MDPTPVAPARARLSAPQRRLIDAWLPRAHLVADHGWGLVETTVLELVADGERYILRAGGPQDHHIARELRAHRKWLRPWVSTGHAPELVHGDEAAKVLLTRYLPGALVLGSPAQDDPAAYRQAGRLLALLHDQHEPSADDDYWAHERTVTLEWLARPHRIPPAHVDRLRREIEGWPDHPAYVAPTHGDWQPRNWLWDDGAVKVIDFGRAALRPPMSDLVRLTMKDFRRDRRLERAFFEGYGPDPRSGDAWRRLVVREALGTAA